MNSDTVKPIEEKRVVVHGAFDNLNSRDIRFLQEASQSGRVHLLLWSDRTVGAVTGRDPSFPEGERRYLLESIRFVDKVTIRQDVRDIDIISEMDAIGPDVWFVREPDDNEAKRKFCTDSGLDLRVIGENALSGYPDISEVEGGSADISAAACSNPAKVVVTGCYDWFHSGHVRFFEEVAELGALYVVLGHDANVRLLKGEGHPLFPQDERRYIVQSIRFVKQALISTGTGWLDAEPEIELLKPDIYAVNEDGDKPEKRQFCEKHGLQYVVLKRTPKEGLPRRTSTNLRGF